MGKLLVAAKAWSKRNAVPLGIAEMAVGAAILAVGVQMATVDLGTALVGTPWGADFVGGGAFGSAGAIAGRIVGAIGIAGGFGAIGVPAAVLAGGAPIILGMFGFGVGHGVDELRTFVQQQKAAGALEYLADATLVGVGVALLLDGARRCGAYQAVSGVFSYFRDGVLHLQPIVGTAFASTIAEIEDMANVERAGLIGSTVAGGALGAAAGGSLAAAGVAVLGSHLLGGAALALGVVSAPIWPVLLAGGAAAAAAAGATIAIRRRLKRARELRGGPSGA